MKYLDLREIPNEVVIAIYNIYGEKRNGHACEGDNIRYFKDEFKKLFSPSVPSDIAKSKENIVNRFKEEVRDLLVTDTKSAEDLLKSPKYKFVYDNARQWLNFNDESLSAYYRANQSILDFKNVMAQDFEAGLPVFYTGSENGKEIKYVVTKGNVVKVTTYNNRIQTSIVYTESKHKQVVDGLIESVYEETQKPAENA